MVVDVPQSSVEDVGLGHWVGGVGCWHEAFLARLDNCVVLTWSMVNLSLRALVVVTSEKGIGKKKIILESFYRMHCNRKWDVRYIIKVDS